MKIQRSRSEQERSAIIEHIAEVDFSTGAFFTARMNSEVFYPLPEPRFVPAAHAEHMREEDHVVGIEHNGEAKAYPMFIMDLYHQANDVVGGEPLVYNT